MTMNFCRGEPRSRMGARILGALALCLSILAVTTTAAQAWGAEGHRVIALIALQDLSPFTKRRVQALLGGDLSSSLEDASTWADRVRPYRRDTASWHYVDIEIASRGYDRRRDCANDNCVVEQIGRDLRVLQTNDSSRDSKIEALKFLIHFVGDIHQPLHCADNHDRGGNEISVVAGRRHANLHAIWDADVVRALGRDPESLAHSLITNITAANRRAWSRGTSTDWANECFALARTEIYQKINSPNAYSTVMLPNGYARSESPVAAIQLERAGVRLAVLLNRALGQ